MLLDRLLRAGEGKTLRALQGIVAQVNAIEEDFVALSDEELRAKTDEFRERLAEGESLDDLLAEAFATAREAARRVLGQRHFDVQIMGGAALHLGNIAEMRTGEGKTLTCVLPAYLNGLAGRGVHVVTVNDYLARRDAEWMGRVHRFLGLSVGVILANETPDVRKPAYECDITYGTNNEFGFDYLRDNMAVSADDLVQRGHAYAIVDEVDSILIDEARTPLIISGTADQPTKWYQDFARIAPRLTAGTHYDVDEAKKTVAITEAGVAVVEDQLGIENLYEAINTPLIGYLQNALRAKELFLRDRDYIVVDGEVLIVDEFTGRVLHGRRFNEGMHQAIEAKEGVEIKQEQQTLATITLQNYFRLYDKLAGMTGTAMTEAAEFDQIYKLGVVQIPTNRDMVRIDQPDVIYKSEQAKFDAVVEDIVGRHEAGQPVLVGTTSVDKSELLSGMLLRRGIPHEVLNAKFHEREAPIVAQAGRLGAVTVATNMAGRGTDIMLGGNPEFIARAALAKRGITPSDTPEEFERDWPDAIDAARASVADEHEKVLAAGGLYVLGTERHESRRIDNQLRGRAGRQGDPGESRFYLSLGDDLMRLFNAGWVEWVMDRFQLPDEVPIEHKATSKAILSAQTQVESQNFEIRKNVLKYDEVLNKQREVIYAERRRVLHGEDLHEQVRSMINDIVAAYIDGATGEGYPEDWDLDELWRALRGLYPVSISVDAVVEAAGGRGRVSADELVEQLTEDAQSAYDRREEAITPDVMREVERHVILSVLDRKWREHLYEMDYLKEGISLRSYGQRDPLVEYQREAFDLFTALLDAIKEESVGYLFNLEVRTVDEAAATGQILDVSPVATDAPGAATGQTADVQPPPLPSEEHRAVAEVLGLRQPKQPDKLNYSAPNPDAGTGVVHGQNPSRSTGANPAADPEISRNAPCPCGSGRKYKRCHGAPGGGA